MEDDFCPHDIKEIKVIATCVTCEVTQMICSSCGDTLGTPKTEC